MKWSHGFILGTEIIQLHFVTIGISKKCPVLPNPQNGSIKYTSGRSVGDEVWYICNHGYSLIGEESRTCLSNQKWSLKAPDCKRAYRGSYIGVCVLVMCCA